MCVRALSNAAFPWALAILLGFGCQAQCAISDLLVADPATVYIQWLNTSSSPMTEADGDLSTSAVPFSGGAMVQLSNPVPKECYLGLMINRISGYDVTLTASNSGATATTAHMTVTGGADMVYSCSLAKIPSTFKGGTVAADSLDLTGGAKSATAVFVAEPDLPLATTEPNIWRLTFTFPNISSVSDGLILSGTYTGGITATVVIK